MESTFASRVRQFRQHKSLSQQAFAEQCELAQGNIAHMESGTEPKQSNVSKLLSGFPDLNPDWLLNGTGPMLRDGQTLTPVAVPLARPDATATTTMALNRPTPEEYRQLQEENRQLREQLAAQSGKLVAVEDERTRLFTELIKKPEASADAASLFDTVDQIAAEYQIAPCELPAIQRFRPRPAPRMVIGGFGQSVA